jgi:hypothetical protein
MLARMCRCGLRFGMLLLLVVSMPAYAGIDELPFELRLFLAVDRQSNYSSTLARQASIAALDGGSSNPGGAAYRETTKPTTTITASAVYAPSTGGREVVAAPLSLRWQGPGLGTIALAYAYTETLHGAGDNGLVRSLRSDEWIAGYGRRIAENAAAGITVRLTNGRIVSDTRAEALGGVPLRSDTSFLAPDVSVGVAGQLTSTITAGIAAGYSRARADSTITNLAPLPVTPAPGVSIMLPAGSLLDAPDDIVSVAALRAGVGLQVDDATAVYFDAAGLHLSTHRSGSADFARFALGAERHVGNGWTLQGGVGVDSRGNVNWSGGFDYRFAAFNAELAIQTNAAPEVNKELGRTRLLSASLGWRF